MKLLLFVSEDESVKFIEFYVNINDPYIGRHKSPEHTKYFGRSFGNQSAFVYTNPNVKISKNDTIYYWLMVMRKDGQIFSKMKFEYTHM